MQLVSCESTAEKSAYIYGLFDPETLEIRYVGKAVDPDGRLYRHLYYSETEDFPKARWIRKLKAAGKEPRMQILEKVPDFIWACTEIKWIAYFKSQGARLLNIDEGGAGWGLGQKHTEATKSKMSKAAKARIYPGWQDKMSQARLGHPVHESTRKKLREKFKGRKLNHESGETISARQKALWAALSPEERARRSAVARQGLARKRGLPPAN